MDTNSSYLALSEHDLYDCIRPSVKKQCNSLRSGDCMEDFSGHSTTNFLPRTCCTKQNNHDRRETGPFNEEFRCIEKLCLCSKTYRCYSSQSNKFNFSSKGLKTSKKEHFETVVMLPSPKTAKFLKKLLM